MPRSNKNKVELTGLVTETPVLDEVGGTSRLTIKMRVRSYRKKGGVEREYFERPTVVFYGEKAENLVDEVNAYFVIGVDGRLEARAETVVVGYVLRVLATPKQGPSTANPTSDGASDDGETAAEEVPEAEAPDAEPSAASEIRATPGAKALAEEKGVALSTITGTGQEIDGVATIIKSDVAAAVHAEEEKEAEAAELRQRAAAEVDGGDPESEEEAS